MKIYGCNGWTCSLSDFCWCTLGFVEGGQGVENARITGRELVNELRYPSVPDCRKIKVSQGLASEVLQQFRQEVLQRFFTEYPEAIWIENWKQVASAVSAYTAINGVSWKPSKASIVNTRQKALLLKGNRPLQSVFYNSVSQRLVCQHNGKIKQRKVKPIKRNDDFLLVPTIFVPEEGKAKAA